MKKINSIEKVTIMLVLSLSIGFISCKKTTVGPAGPQGEPGQQGATGQQGNANVKSVLFTSTYTWHADSTNKLYFYEQHHADISTSVIQNGAVMLYLGDESGTEWRAMPFSYKGLDYAYEIELGTVEIIVSASNKTMPAYPGVQKFKMIIIPPAS